MKRKKYEYDIFLNEFFHIFYKKIKHQYFLNYSYTNGKLYIFKHVDTWTFNWYTKIYLKNLQTWWNFDLEVDCPIFFFDKVHIHRIFFHIRIILILSVIEYLDSLWFKKNNIEDFRLLWWKTNILEPIKYNCSKWFHIWVMSWSKN